MADKYISVKAALVALHGDETVHIPSLMLAHKRIATLPAADVVERKRGEWEVCESGNDCICTACHRYWIPNGDQYDYHYCPNCGAEMRILYGGFIEIPDDWLKQEAQDG